MLGLGIMLVRSLTAPEQAGNSSYFDWFFLFIIFGTGVTGLLTELVRWSGVVVGAYYPLCDSSDVRVVIVPVPAVFQVRAYRVPNRGHCVGKIAGQEH